MKIYFFASAGQAERVQLRHAKIRELLNRSGITVATNLAPLSEVSASWQDRAEELGQSLLDQMDALVIEGTQSDPEVGYLLAYAISGKKPTLYLMEKGSQAKNPLSYLAPKNIPTNIIVRTYTDQTIDRAVSELLEQVEHSEYAETPSIKFTLRITPMIEQYLHWKTHNTELTKADFLRQLIIDDVIKRDEEYKKYRRRHL
jgi:hypothetical protein